MDLLLLDDVWTLAVADKDEAAPQLGRAMEALIEDLRERGGRLQELMGHTRYELNASWPETRARLSVPKQQLAALDEYIKEYGGLGDAGFAIAAEFDASLAEEAELLATKIRQIESGGPSIGDLSRLRKIMLAVLAVAVFASVAIPVVTAVATGASVAVALATAATNLANAAVGIAGGAILMEPVGGSGP